MGTKILIVDDEPDVQKMILAQFRKEINNKELEFSFGANGAEALEILKKDPTIGLVFTDINMPIMDGLTLLGNILELESKHKVIVVSAYGDMSNIRTAMNRGASDFITKPINFADFTQTLQKMTAEYPKSLRLHEIQQELQVAQKIQHEMLPKNFSPFPRRKLDIAGAMISSQEVGGDYFDFFPLDDHRLAVVIADVSEKGISGCLCMAITRVLFRMLAKKNISCSHIMKEIDELLPTQSASLTATAFYGIIDFEAGNISYSNAGHQFPYIVRWDGKIIALKSENSPALGAGPVAAMQKNYTEDTMFLREGDCLYLYTAGITGAKNSQNESFGTPRLEQALLQSHQKPMAELNSAVVASLMDFTKDARQSDDITMLALRYSEDHPT